MKSGQVTIKDIARELGISPSTVSRALKDHPDISPETKKLVNELAKKLHYQPNSIALSLRSSKTNTIGVIVPEIVHFFFSTVIAGIEKVAYDAGYNVMFCQSAESYEREVSDTYALLAHRVDGLLVSVSRETTNFDHLKEAMERGTPLVLFDRMVNQLDASQVIVDDENGGYQATAHLIDQGCKRIAHMAGPTSLLLTENRIKGYKKALAEKGIPLDKSLIINCVEGTQLEGENCTKRLMSSSNPPDGIFTNTDLVGLGCMVAAKELNLQIPEDLAVVGFSNWRFSSLVKPSLSSILQPGVEMGKKATELLLKEIKSGKENSSERVTQVLETKLLARDSSTRK